MGEKLAEEAALRQAAEKRADAAEERLRALADELAPDAEGPLQLGGDVLRLRVDECPDLVHLEPLARHFRSFSSQSSPSVVISDNGLSADYAAV